MAEELVHTVYAAQYKGKEDGVDANPVMSLVAIS